MNKLQLIEKINAVCPSFALANQGKLNSKATKKSELQEILASLEVEAKNEITVQVTSSGFHGLSVEQANAVLTNNTGILDMSNPVAAEAVRGNRSVQRCLAIVASEKLARLVNDDDANSDDQLSITVQSNGKSGLVKVTDLSALVAGTVRNDSLRAGFSAHMAFLARMNSEFKDSAKHCYSIEQAFEVSTSGIIRIAGKAGKLILQAYGVAGKKNTVLRNRLAAQRRIVEGKVCSCEHLPALLNDLVGETSNGY